MIENKILKKKKFSAKISSEENQHQNFEKHMKQKRCAKRRLTGPNIFNFYEKFRLTW